MPEVRRDQPGERTTTGRYVLAAGLVLAGWVLCAIVGGSALGIGTLMGCHINEGSDGDCPVLGGIAISLLLLAAFGSPLFILAILICVVGAVISYFARRRH